MENIICILVLYNPSPEILRKTIESIINQIGMLWISDNTVGGFAIDSVVNIDDKKKIVYHQMDGNEGLAKAQNCGIEYAINNDYEYIFFLDQDTISENNVVMKLRQSYDTIEFLGVKVGGVGPQLVNRESGEIYKRECIYKLGVIQQVPQLTNSGSLIKTRVFVDVGMMNDDLFIDGIDYDLCWRAIFYCSYHFFIIDNIRISHKLGEGDRHFLGKTIKISTPFRTYYQFRNWLFLLREEYVPFKWKFLISIKFIIKYFYFPIFVKPRWDYFVNINRGIMHGLFKF